MDGLVRLRLRKGVELVESISLSMTPLRSGRKSGSTLGKLIRLVVSIVR